MAPGAGAATVPSMLIGVFGLNSYASAAPRDRARAGPPGRGPRLRLAVGRRARGAPQPAGGARADGADRRHPGPAGWLAFVAAATTAVRLATGIIILPQRQPLVLAKQVASLDVLSGGRLVLGSAPATWSPSSGPSACPWPSGAAGPTSTSTSMRALWTEPGPVSFHGRYTDVDGIDAHPRPVQAGGPPIVVGGRSAGALPPGRRPRPRLVRLPPDGRGGGRAGGGPGALPRRPRPGLPTSAGWRSASRRPGVSTPTGCGPSPTSASTG